MSTADQIGLDTGLSSFFGNLSKLYLEDQERKRDTSAAINKLLTEQMADKIKSGEILQQKVGAASPTGQAPMPAAPLNLSGAPTVSEGISSYFTPEMASGAPQVGPLASVPVTTRNVPLDIAHQRQIYEATLAGKPIPDNIVDVPPAKPFAPEDATKITYTDKQSGAEYTKDNTAEEKNAIIAQRMSVELRRAQNNTKVKSDAPRVAALKSEANNLSNQIIYNTDPSQMEMLTNRLSDVNAELETYGITGKFVAPEEDTAPPPKKPAQPKSKPSGKIRVRRKDGQTGTIDAKDFDPAKYTKI